MMFNNFFINTRSSLDRIRRQLNLITHLVSLITSLFFIAYYVYLICTNLEHPVYLGIYSGLLVVTVFMMIIDLVYVGKKAHTRIEKRLNVEHKRRFSLVSKIIKTVLKLTAIIVSGYEISQTGASQFQLIAYTLTIVMFIVNIVVNIIINVVTADIDMIRLSIAMDIERSRILSAIFADKEYTDQEQKIRKDIQLKTDEYKDRKQFIKNKISNLFK